MFLLQEESDKDKESKEKLKNNMTQAESPIYASIDHSSLKHSFRRPTRRRLYNVNSKANSTDSQQHSPVEHHLYNLNSKVNSTDNDQHSSVEDTEPVYTSQTYINHTSCLKLMKKSKYLKTSMFRDSGCMKSVYSPVECVDETTEQFENLDDVEHRLRSASVFSPANVMMLTIKSHRPSSREGQISVSKGMLVTGLFMASSWVCVKLPSGVCGYLPYSCVQPMGVRTCKDFSQQYPDESQDNSLDGDYVLADSVHSDDSTSNYRCVLNETIAKSRELINSTDRDTLYLNSTATFTPKVNKTSHHTSTTNKCYICNRSSKVKVTTSSNKKKKLTCSSCVLSELSNTVDNGYESARSDFGYSSMTNTCLHDSNSNLLQSIDSLNDSGQETDSGQTSSVVSTDRGTCLTVLFDYDQKGNYDLSIRKQDVVTLLYDKHDQWYWVRNREGSEGYVPKSYVVNLEQFNLDPTTKTTYL